MSDTGLEQDPESTSAGSPGEGLLLPTFGPYQLQELIGRGGMGEVYRAYDTSRDRLVALKRLPTSMAADPTFQARFRAEAALAAKLHDPHVIPIHDFGEIDGQLYIDMRLVEGPDLAHLLKESGPLPAQRAVDIVTQVATALDAAHATGLVHRDIKPANVLVVRSEGDLATDFVYVADFGIARALDGGTSGGLTSTGTTVGSLDYVAPERFANDHGDRRADIYALGCVLYEALTAERPFPVQGLPAIINAHFNTPPPAPTAKRGGLPVGLDAVVARAMAKDPDERYQTAGALAADARRALDGATIAAPITPATPAGQAAHGAGRAGYVGAVAHGSGQAASADPAAHAPSAGPAAHGVGSVAPGVGRAAFAGQAAQGVGQAPSARPVGYGGGWAASAEQAAQGAGQAPSAAPVGYGGGWAASADSDASAIVRAPARAPAPLSRRRRVLTVVATVATMLVLVASVGATQLIKPAAGGGEVFLEATGTPGQDPFTGTTVVGDPPGATSQTPLGATGADVPTIAGDTPALYGGSTNEHVCDRQKLVAFLQQNPDKAAAWAGVLNISVADIPAYVGRLTPVQLRADTRVTNHGFVDGHATSLQSVLQAGTAVLVDDQGRPRVKCGCGNPLLDPVATPITPAYTGDPWPGFNPRNVSAVSQATTPVDRFVVHDLRTGATFYRPRGTDGDQDQPTSPPAVTTTTPPPPPSPTGVRCPQGTHLQGAACVANTTRAPLRCPDGQVVSGGRCVATQVSCPDGSHPSEDGTSCDRDQPDCPDGQHASGSSCVPDSTGKQCPSGTEQNGSSCVPTCEDGYHLSGSNRCVKDCPEGYSQDARGGCVPPTRPSCPVGTTRTNDGSCAEVTGRRPPRGRRKPR